MTSTRSSVAMIGATLAAVSMLSIAAIAHICHDANRAVCIENGDHSQVPWEDAPEWQKQSAMQGVAVIIENPTTTPAQLHEAWCKAKLDDGWTYNQIKDADHKTHPCLVPYDQLPAEQQRKDVVFRAIVTALTQPREAETKTEPVSQEVKDAVDILNFCKGSGVGGSADVKMGDTLLRLYVSA